MKLGDLVVLTEFKTSLHIIVEDRNLNDCIDDVICNSDPTDPVFQKLIDVHKNRTVDSIGVRNNCLFIVIK